MENIDWGINLMSKIIEECRQQINFFKKEQARAEGILDVLVRERNHLDQMDKKE